MAAGVAVTVRVAPLPPKAMLAFETSAGLEEAPVNTRLAAAVSASPTEKLNAPVELSSLMV